MKRERRMRMTRAEAEVLRGFIAEAKKRLGAKQGAIIGFAKMFGKFLPEYKICVGGI